MGRRLAITEQTLEPPIVSLAELKRLALQLLPSASTLRAIIMSQPDILPKHEALAKMEIFIQLLHKEVGRS